MREDSSGLSLIIIGTETIDQVMIIQHVDPMYQSPLLHTGPCGSHWDRGVGTTESVTSENLAVVVEAVCQRCILACQE